MVLYVWKYRWTGERGVFSRIAVIDNACSVIWIRRYQKAGEFEVYVPASRELLDIVRQNELFITRENDLKNAMKMQKVALDTDPDEGDFLTITGKSAACILGQRVVRDQWNASGKVQDCIYNVVEAECVEPTKHRDDYQWRKIDVLSIRKTELPVSESFTMQYYGKNAQDVVEEMCAVGGIGYKVEFTGEGFVFSLYAGVDRTVNQSENERVIFSEDFENLGQCTYTYDNTDFCNAVLAIGEGNGSGKASQYWFNHEEVVNSKGLCYYEAAIDGSQVSRTTSTGEMSMDDYFKKLVQLCKIHLSKAKAQDDLNADVFPNNTGKYDLGDRVSVVNRYGIIGSATVTEITETEDASGYRTIPTLGDWSVEKE